MKRSDCSPPSKVLKSLCIERDFYRHYPVILRYNDDEADTHDRSASLAESAIGFLRSRIDGRYKAEFLNGGG